MTFLQLYGAALDIELGTADTQLFTTARRKKAINDAMHDFVRLTNCTKKYGSITIVDGTAEYDLEAEFTDYIRLAGAPSIKIVNGSNTRWIQGRDSFPRRDPEELDQNDPGWRAVSDGTPTFWYLREDIGATYLGMNPGPGFASGDAWTWTVPYVPDPADMSADADEPFTFTANKILRLVPYHQGLAHKAAALLEPLRKNYSGVQRQTQLYSGFIATYFKDRTESGRDEITMARDYYGEARRGVRPLDPRRYP